MPDVSRRPFRWAVLGTGVAARKFVHGLKAADGATTAAVASRDRQNAVSFANDFNIEIAADSVEEAINVDAVDAVYVATPADLHRHHALLSIAAGKPVLVEKPFTTNASEAREIASAATSAGVFCMEAMWTRFLPSVHNIRRMLDRRQIGDVAMMSASFSIADEPAADNRLYMPGHGGGALLQRGIYPLSLAVHFLGLPDSVVSDAVIGASGVDEVTAVILGYKSGTLAQLQAGTRSNAENDCFLLGTEGRIHLHAPIYRPFRATFTPVRARVRQEIGGLQSRFRRLKESGLVQSAWQQVHRLPLSKRGSKTFNWPYRGNGYHYQADAVRRAIEAGEPECSTMPLSESVEIMEIMDAIRGQWRHRLDAGIR